MLFFFGCFLFFHYFVTTMNIHLASLNQKKKKTKNTKSTTVSYGYGLNPRGEGQRSDTVTNQKANVLNGSDDEDDDEQKKDIMDGSHSNKHSGRYYVNQEIVAEQAALRKRAQAVAAAITAADSAEQSNIYDYDGAYESFASSSSQQQQQQQGNNNPLLKEKTEERKSRYIEDLLQASKKRQRERESIYERKIAREQAEEDAQLDFKGKEKFITKAYRRKLEERKQWEQEEENRKREEEQEDVTKKTAGEAFGSFYGNFSRNIAMGGTTNKNDEREVEGSKKGSETRDVGSRYEEDHSKDSIGVNFSEGFERSDEADARDVNDSRVEHPKSVASDQGKDQPEVKAAMTMREKREKKIAEARIRYLERRKMALQ